MKETALQQFINKIREWQAHTKSVIEKDAFNDCILQAELLLPTEKQQIEDAWDDGYNKGFSRGEQHELDDMFAPRMPRPTDYFTETYKTD